MTNIHKNVSAPECAPKPEVKAAPTPPRLARLGAATRVRSRPIPTLGFRSCADSRLSRSRGREDRRLQRLAAEVTRVLRDVHGTGCMTGVEVEVSLCWLPGTGHILYDNALSFDVPANAWESERGRMDAARFAMYQAARMVPPSRRHGICRAARSLLRCGP